MRDAGRELKCGSNQGPSGGRRLLVGTYCGEFPALSMFAHAHAALSSGRLAMNRLARAKRLCNWAVFFASPR